MRKLILFVTFLLSAVCLLSAQEARTLSGKVVDENGEALIGAGVVLPGGTRGTVTDLDGKYTLQLKADDAAYSGGTEIPAIGGVVAKAGAKVEDTADECGFKRIEWIQANGVITTHGGPAAFGLAGFTKK